VALLVRIGAVLRGRRVQRAMGSPAPGRELRGN